MWVDMSCLAGSAIKSCGLAAIVVRIVCHSSCDCNCLLWGTSSS